jgi:hypothetical protein
MIYYFTADMLICILYFSACYARPRFTAGVLLQSHVSSGLAVPPRRSIGCAATSNGLASPTYHLLGLCDRCLITFDIIAFRFTKRSIYIEIFSLLPAHLFHLHEFTKFRRAKFLVSSLNFEVMRIAAIAPY